MLLASLAPLALRAEPPATFDSNEGVAKQRPQADDLLVHAAEDRIGEPITVDSLTLATSVLAWPMDPASKQLRNGSRLNQIRVLRCETSDLKAKSADNAANGIVAFAATCSHAGCDVGSYNAASKHLVCPCHGSEFDITDGATVIKGPATKPLAMLPLKVIDGVLVAAAGFTRQVGVKPA